MIYNNQSYTKKIKQDIYIYIMYVCKKLSAPDRYFWLLVGSKFLFVELRPTWLLQAKPSVVCDSGSDSVLVVFYFQTNHPQEYRIYITLWKVLYTYHIITYHAYMRNPSKSYIIRHTSPYIIIHNQAYIMQIMYRIHPTNILQVICVAGWLNNSQQ